MDLEGGGCINLGIVLMDPCTPCRAPSPVRPRPPGPAQGVASATLDLSPVSQKATLGSLCLLKAQILHPYFFPLTKCSNMGLIRVLYMFTTTQYDLRIKEKSISARKHSCILFSIKEKSISLCGQVGVHNLLFPTCLIGLVLNQVRKSIRKHFTNVSSHGFTHTHTHTHTTHWKSFPRTRKALVRGGHGAKPEVPGTGQNRSRLPPNSR